MDMIAPIAGQNLGLRNGFLDDRVVAERGQDRRMVIMLQNIQGDMSLIGPRPLSTEEALKIPEDAFCRYAVPAGLTGLAQIKARSVVVDPSRFNWDIAYLNQLGGRQELIIFLHTFAAIRDKC